MTTRQRLSLMPRRPSVATTKSATAIFAAVRHNDSTILPSPALHPDITVATTATIVITNFTPPQLTPPGPHLCSQVERSGGPTSHPDFHAVYPSHHSVGCRR